VTKGRGKLRDKMDAFLETLGDVEKAINEQSVDFLTFVEELISQGWKESEVKEIKGVLIRDQMIFEPRPGFIKRCRQ